MIRLIFVIALLTGCQTYKQVDTEYYESGKVKRKIITDRSGLPNWSENKNITVRGSVVK